MNINNNISQLINYSRLTAGTIASSPNRHSQSSQLAALPRAWCDCSLLCEFDFGWLSVTFREPAIGSDWAEDGAILYKLGMPDMTGGVNRGDQRALYYLARRLKPTSVLEIGTHIWSSTVALALAAARGKAQITTVDIRDVNEEAARPWEIAQSPASLASLLKVIGLANRVQFKVSTAIEILGKADNMLYGIFLLDGEHSAVAVY